ncbi:MAG: hypothetical protein U1E40_05715 [Amaricoccus sp.]
MRIDASGQANEVFFARLHARLRADRRRMPALEGGGFNMLHARLRADRRRPFGRLLAGRGGGFAANSGEARTGRVVLRASLCYSLNNRPAKRKGMTWKHPWQNA